MISKCAILVLLVCIVAPAQGFFDFPSFTPLSRVQLPTLLPTDIDGDRFDNTEFDIEQEGTFEDNTADCDTDGCQANSGAIVDFQDVLTGFTGTVLVKNLAQNNTAQCEGDLCLANSGIFIQNDQPGGRVSFQSGANNNDARCEGEKCVANAGILKTEKGVDLFN